MCFAIGCKVEKFKIDIGEKFEKFVHFQLNAPCVCLSVYESIHGSKGWGVFKSELLLLNLLEPLFNVLNSQKMLPKNLPVPDSDLIFTF